MRNRPTLWVAGVAALIVAAPSLAHDFWLEPSTYSPRVGERVAIRVRVGTQFHGEVVPRDPQRIVRFASLTPSGEKPVPGVAGVDPAGFLVVGEAGSYVVTFHSTPSAISLPAEDFERYLLEEGLEGISRLRAERGESSAEGREIFSRCAKTLVIAGSGGAPPTPFAAPFGCPLELLIEGDGYRSIRLLFRGRPLAGVRVAAIPWTGGPTSLEQAVLGELSLRRQPLGESQRTDNRGRVNLQLDRPGPWLIKAVHMEPEVDHPDADWQSWWASLTLVVPPSTPRGLAASSR